jgi:hypothetical protein
MIMAPSSYCRNTLCSIAWGSALLLVLRVSAQAAIAQSPSTSPFQVQYTASGISSLQKVQDKYATDYIQSGLALGDVSIRYRAEGAGQWNEISAASRDPRARGAVAAYSICRLQPTLAGAAHVSASVRGPGVRLLNAAFEPSTSHTISAQPAIHGRQRRDRASGWSIRARSNWASAELFAMQLLSSSTILSSGAMRTVEPSRNAAA